MRNCVLDNNPNRNFCGNCAVNNNREVTLNSDFFAKCAVNNNTRRCKNEIIHTVNCALNNNHHPENVLQITTGEKPAEFLEMCRT